MTATGAPKPGLRVAEASSDRVAAALAEALGGRLPAGKSIVAGLVGRGIQESRSPHMHEEEGRRLGLDYRYALLDFDRLRLDDADLDAALAAAGRLGFAGLNVTHPFKQQVVASLDGVDREAAAIGAVNTVVLRGGRSSGHNTDCWGFAESFRRGMADASRGHVVLVGAGGGGTAVAHALLGLGVERLSVFDTIAAKSEALVASVNRTFGGRPGSAVHDLPAAVAKAHGLVNSTPTGMAKYPGTQVPAVLLRPEMWVADIVYFPAETLLLRQARAAGCRTLSGSGMAIFQAVKAFELITGRSPDPGQMQNHFG